MPGKIAAFKMSGLYQSKQNASKKCKGFPKATRLRHKNFCVFAAKNLYGQLKKWISGSLLLLVMGAAPAVLAEVTLTTEYTDSSIAYRGDVRTLRITVLNSGTHNVTAGTLTSSNVLPSEFVIAAPGGAVGGTCGATVTASPDTRAISFTGATIPAASGGTNGSCYVDVNVRVNVNPPSIASYTTAVAAGLFSGNEDGTTVSNANPASIGLSVGSLGTLTVGKGFSPSTLRMGDASTITITITNPAARPRETTITQLTENLPANVTATGTVTGGTCGSGTASGTSGSVTITLAAPPTLNPGQSCTVTWPVRGNAANGNVTTNTNTVPANSVTNERGMPHSAANANITVQSPVTLSKNFQYDSIRPDQPVRMRIEVENRSANPASISFVDNLPVGMVISTPNSLNVTNCGAVPSAAQGGGVVSLIGGTVAAGATCRIDVDVQAADSNIDGGGNSIPYINTIAGVDWSQTVDGNPINGTTGSASDQVTVYNEFTIHKNIAGPSGQSLATTGVVAGDLVRFQINLRNYSAAAVTGVSVTDVLPQAGGAQLQVATSAAPGGIDPLTTCAGTPIFPANGVTTAVFSGLNVPAGSGAQHGECYVRFWALVPSNWPANTNIANNLNASPNFGIACDGGSACDIQSGGQNSSVTVAGASNAQHLEISKGFLPATVAQGQVSVLTITLNNNGFWPLNNASVEDVLPVGSDGGQLVVAPLPGASTTCGGTPVYEYLNDQATFRVSGLSVPARSLCRVSVNVVGALAGSYVNEIPTANVDAIDARDNRNVEPADLASATLTVTPTFSVTKSFSPALVAQNGGVSRVTIVVDNNGSSALTGMKITDPLTGTGLLVADTPAASTTCAGPTVISAVAGAAQAQLSGAQVPPGTSCTFSFNTVTDGSLGAANSINTLPPGAVTADGGMATNTPTTATLTKLGSPAVPYVQKSFSPASLNTLGETSILTISIENNGAGAVSLTGVGLVDNMPEAIEVAALPMASTTCAGGVVNAVPGSSQVTLSDAALASGETCQISVKVVLNRTGTHTNTVQPGWLTNDQNVTNTNIFPANLGTVANAGVDKSFSPATIAPSEASLMTIRVVNQSIIQLTNLQITDDLPAGLVPASPHNANSSCGGTLNVTPTQITLSGGNVAPLSVCLLTLDMTAAVAGTYTNQLPPGSVTAGEEPNLIPPGSSATGTLTVRNPLAVSKSFASPTRLINQSNRLTVTITNPNPVPITDVRLTDTYPAGVFNTTTPNPQVICTSGVHGVVTAPSSEDFIRLTGATLAAGGGTCTFSADVLSNSPGTYVNTIPESAVYSAESVTNTNPAQNQFIVTEPPVLGKSFDPVQIPSGGTSHLYLVLGNNNAAPITLSSHLHDDLPQSPGAMTATNINNALTTCTVGQVTLQDSGAGANTRVRYASGATIPAGGCVIVVDVTATVSGQYTNQIPAGGLNTSAGPNSEPATATLAVSTNHAVTGKVYMDHDNNGQVGASEPGISAQTIELWRNGSFYQSTVTDSLGNYAFLELPDGNYVVRQPHQPPNTVNGQTTPGSEGGNATSPAVTPSAISAIQLTGAGTTPMLSTDNNFGELAFVSISGKVFLDVNNNGTQQGTEPALSGETISLQREQGGSWVVAGSTTTVADGSYAFTQLPPGTYRVVQPNQPDGTANGQTIAGSGSTAPGVASNPNTTGVTSLIEGIVLVSGEASVGNDFAEIPAGRSVYGRVFLDYDDNGVVNGPDTGIAGQAIRLQGRDINDNPVDRTVTTATDGTFVFTGLPESDLNGYTLIQPNQPTGTLNGITTEGSAGGTPTARNATPSRIEGIVLAGGVTISANNLFAEVPAPVLAVPDLVISKTHQPKVFTLGETGVYTLVPSNIGATQTSARITVVDTLPSGLSVSEEALGNGWNCSVAGQIVTCYTDSIIAAQSQGEPIILHVKVAEELAGKVVVNVATISGGGEPESATDNNRTEDPTQVGADGPDLVLSKSHAPEIFLISQSGVYTIVASNQGAAPTSGIITVVDELPAGILVSGSPSGDNWNCSASGQVITCSSEQVLKPGFTASPITIPVTISADMKPGVVVNTAHVSGGNEKTVFTGNNAAHDSAEVMQCSLVAGTVWRDLNHDRVLDPGEPRLSNWIVSLYQENNLVETRVTDHLGKYEFSCITPGSGYGIRFRDAETGVTYGRAIPNERGTPYTPGEINQNSNPAGAVVSSGDLDGLTLLPGVNVLEQSLPIDPAGVVYDSETREPISGAVVVISGPPGFTEQHVVGGSSSIITGSDGFYQFLLNPDAPPGIYTLTVDAPAEYIPAPSSRIPACTGVLDVGSTPDPALVYMNEFAPVADAPLHDPQSCPGNLVALQSGSASTQYYFRFRIDANSADVVNNHIPLDPWSGAVALRKTTPLVNVSRGDLVPYVITARNTRSSALNNIVMEDHLPPGFQYVKGSARLNGINNEPEINDRVLRWPLQYLNVDEEVTLELLLVVGSGVGFNEYINRAWVVSHPANVRASNIGSAKVYVVPDPIFDCTDIIGQVFDDRNRDGYQNEGEPGIPGVRLVSPRGWLITTDNYGRFHVACADVPNELRGGNFILKLDERSLPAGYRVTTENPRVARMTQGRMVKMSFGASIHRVVRLDLTPVAFTKTHELLPEYSEQLLKLLPLLHEEPSILRIAYRLGFKEEVSAARSRINSVQQWIKEQWEEQGCCYDLRIEEEIIPGSEQMEIER